MSITLEIIIMLDANVGETGVGKRKVGVERSRTFEHLQRNLQVLTCYAASVIPAPKIKIVRMRVFGRLCIRADQNADVPGKRYVSDAAVAGI